MRGGIMARLFPAKKVPGWNTFRSMNKGMGHTMEGFSKLWKRAKVLTKIGNIFKFIGNIMLKPIQLIGKIGTKLGTFAGTITKVGKFIPMIGGLFKTFGKGIPILGWILTAFDGVKGFIKGFTDTEGNLMEKILGGTVGALKSIIDGLFGWIFDLVDKIFGTDLRSSFDSFLENIGKIFGFVLSIITAPFELGYNIIKGIWNWGQGADNPFQGLKDFVSEKFTAVKEAITGPFKSAWNYLKGIIQKIKDNIKSIPFLGRFFSSEEATAGVGSASPTTTPKKYNDVVITPQGKAIRTNPMDYIMAMKDPGAGGEGNMTKILTVLNEQNRLLSQILRDGIPVRRGTI
jgi:phage-related protein